MDPRPAGRRAAPARVFILEIVPRAQHYVQACAHTAILLYWGWHWPPVYEYAYLIVAQLLFAYSFDMLLAWSRRDTYTLGFGPFPIIFSTNLFLWFKADWFYLQFLMIAVGFAAKECIRWNKDGRRTHVFNPSSFSLTVFSLALLADRHDRHHLGPGHRRSRSSTRRTCTCSCSSSRFRGSSCSASRR